MRIILFGATGMLGLGVLRECLADPDVTHVLSIGRRATDVQHVKLKQIVHDDFTDYSEIGEHLAGFDACFFCLGASSVGMSEERYRHITYDVTLAAAQALLASSQGLVFCYVSAAGTDISEQGRSMWARVRGKTENDCSAPGFLDSGLTVFASMLPRPARRSHVAPERGFDSGTSLASTARCTSA